MKFINTEFLEVIDRRRGEIRFYLSLPCILALKRHGLGLEIHTVFVCDRI